MKYSSYNSTKLFGLALCASSVLLSASMAQAENRHMATGAICQTASSNAQASYSSTGKLYNRDEESTLNVVCPLYRAHNGRAYDLRTSVLGTQVTSVVINYVDNHPTDNLRCRVGTLEFSGDDQLKTSYKSSESSINERGYLGFNHVELEPINKTWTKSSRESELLIKEQNAYYLYCKIPKKSSTGMSYIRAISWMEK